MVSKTAQDIKREKKRLKREKIDKVTNGYMINLAWGVLLVILLRLVESGYMTNALGMPTAMKIFAGIFGVIAIGLIACGIKNVLNKRSSFLGYGFFTLVLSFGSLWIGFFAPIRTALIKVLPNIANVDSRWWISRGPIVLVVAYLVVTLVYTAIKVALIERNKQL